MSARGSICTETREQLLEIRALASHRRRGGIIRRLNGCTHGGMAFAHPLESSLLTYSPCQLARCPSIRFVCFGGRAARLLCCVTCGEAEVLVRRAAHTEAAVITGMCGSKWMVSARFRAVGRRLSTDWEGYAGVVVQNGCGTLLLEDHPSEMMGCKPGVRGFEEC
jgi:hypothetical protein